MYYLSKCFDRRCIQILVKNLDGAFSENCSRVSAINYFCKSSILDILLGSEYASADSSKPSLAFSKNEVAGLFAN